jgi:hypothetical protein
MYYRMCIPSSRCEETGMLFSHGSIAYIQPEWYLDVQITDLLGGCCRQNSDQVWTESCPRGVQNVLGPESVDLCRRKSWTM